MYVKKSSRIFKEIQRCWSNMITVLFLTCRIRFQNSFLTLVVMTQSLVFKYPNRKYREGSRQTNVKLERQVRDQSRGHDNFQTATDALHDCDVVEHSRVETTREDLPLVHLSVFEEN
jgi:hypothetical protein